MFFFVFSPRFCSFFSSSLSLSQVFSDKLQRFLTCCAGITCHAQFFVPNCNISLVLSMFKCSPGKTGEMMSLLLLNSFYPVISYRRVRKRKRKRRIVVRGSVTRYGPRTSLPAQRINIASRSLGQRWQLSLNWSTNISAYRFNVQILSICSDLLIADFLAFSFVSFPHFLSFCSFLSFLFFFVVVLPSQDSLQRAVEKVDFAEEKKRGE